MKAFRIVAVLLLLLASLPAEARTITLGILPAPEALPLFVAVREGLFAEHGLVVALAPYASSLERDSALQEGRLDGFAGDMVDTLLLIQAGREMEREAGRSGTSLKIVATISASRAGQRLFGLVTSPRLKGLSAKDLPRHSVGIAQSTSMGYLLELMEARNGLGAGALRTIDITGMPVQLRMLMSGEIDTALLPEPLLTQAERKGGTVLLTDENLDIPQTVLCLKAPLAADPAFLAPFLHAYGEAVERIRANPEKYRPLMAQSCGIPEELSQTFPVFVPPLPALPSQEQLLPVQQWMLKRGLLHTQLRYEGLTAGP